jgi:hypothetical protein
MRHRDGTKIRAQLPNLWLKELVPKDNFYYRLEATLDLSFVRELVKECHASFGPSERRSGGLLSPAAGDILRRPAPSVGLWRSRPIA